MRPGVKEVTVIVDVINKNCLCRKHEEQNSFVVEEQRALGQRKKRSRGGRS